MYPNKETRKERLKLLQEKLSSLQQEYSIVGRAIQNVEKEINIIYLLEDLENDTRN